MICKIILDANVASEFPRGSPEAEAVTAWLLRKGILTTGGKNLRELAIVSKIGHFVQQLIKAGRAFIVDGSDLGKCEEHVVSLPLRSNDSHVIALALASGARLLYSRDQALIQDFKDQRFVRRPRGKCYLDAEKHSHLLK
jgi:predicted nucleic acid-binding protein